MMEDNTIKQMRVKFSAIEEAETSHRKLPSQSFKGGGDSRRVENRYRGESSDREVTYNNYDYMESDEFRTAVAAAAFAIHSVEEKRRSAAKQRVDDSSSLSTNNSKLPARKKHMKDKIPSFSGAASNKKTLRNNYYKEDDTVPISTPRLLSKKFSELKEKVPQSSRPAAEKADLASSRSSIESKVPIPAARNMHPEDIKADAWEKIQMDKIKQRYENLNAKIVEWEKEKKEKAQKKLSRNKDKKRGGRGVQKYKSEMEMIDEIVQGARAQAEENRRKEEIKLKKKSDMIRLTGKIPTKTSCLCF